MKLLRFELASAPGYTRSGIVYGDKVYETDGTQAIGVHEWSEVVPFLPTGQPPSYRFFRSDPVEEAWLRGEETRPYHCYLNPASLIPPNRAMAKPIFTSELGFEAQLAIVVGASGSNIAVDEADTFILGLTVANTFVAKDIERQEIQHGSGPGRSRDFGTALGPFLTTPEELDDIVVDDSRGRRYKLEAIVRVNGEEIGRQNLTDLPFTCAELVSFASETSTLMPGDLIGVGPVGTGELKPSVDAGDEVLVLIERLGPLATRIT